MQLMPCIQDPEVVADYPCVLGESPIWHAAENRLYWLDILAGRVFCYDPRRAEFSELVKTGLIGAVTIQSDGSLLLFKSAGEVASFRNGALLAASVRARRHHGYRFNDCVVDPRGRVYSGVLARDRRGPTRRARAAGKLRRLLGLRPSRATGHVVRFDTDGRVKTVIRGIGRPNGMGFSPDRTRLYVTDSLARSIHAYEYNEEQGSVANPRLFVRVPASTRATPDGLAVDSCGFVWSAHMNGGCVVRYRPDGTEERRIALPTPRVTNLTFGGADYQDMYVTTAGGDRRDRYGSAAGAVFHVRPGVSGLPDFQSRIPA